MDMPLARTFTALYAPTYTVSYMVSWSLAGSWGVGGRDG